jgi:hypothetical protein
MDSVRHNEPRGLAGDIRRAKEGAGATADELREFVRSLKGKNPQEVLGMVAQSRLTQGVVVATFWCVVLMAIGTAVPFYWDQIFPSATKPVAAKPAEQSKPASEPAAQANAPAAPAQATPAPAPATTPAPVAKTPAGPANLNPPEPSAANQKALVDKLKLDETKSSDPKKNPLEDKADDLLKDLGK